MAVNQWHFDNSDPLGLATRRGLEELVSNLPIIARDKANAFFDEAEKISSDSRAPRETPRGTLAEALFSNLMSTLAASDRQDFDAMMQIDSGGVTDGILMVETYDAVIPTLQCVARVADDSYLTRTFGFADVEPVKHLRGAVTA